MVTAGPVGSIRLIMQDASGTRRDVVYGGARTELLALGATDPRLSQYVPAGSATVEEDDYVTIELLGDTAAVAVDEGAVYRIPVRIQNKKTKVVRETFLTAADFGLVSGVTNISSVLSTWVQIGKYTINAQESLRLGHTNAVNSRIYMLIQYTA
jgi:hypothetical protein